MHALVAELNDLGQVDPSQLDALCAQPPRPPFYKNQFVQAVLTSIVIMIGLVLLGLLLAALKH